MVTVTNCLERQRKDGTQFAVLEISGGVELVQSQATQRYRTSAFLLSGI
jgi:hypothetical protein